MGVGSVAIAPRDMWAIIAHKLFGAKLASGIKPLTVSIFWNIRIPRVLTAFAVGGALSVSGAIMQSVLQNPLASSYTIGVSSGASLGAAFILVFNIQLTFLQNLMLPATGFCFGFLTVVLSLVICSRFDSGMSNHTIVLIGMVVSLFVNAVLTLLAALFPDRSQKIYMWMMGSFSARNWMHVSILIPSCVIGTFLAYLLAHELDILSFGDEQAQSMGVNVRLYRTVLILLATLMTAISVSFTGLIGFIDLVAPHAVRKVFGFTHRKLIPMSMIYGGSFMALSDLASRTLIAPREIPVGAITALAGAPFFAFLFFRKKR